MPCTDATAAIFNVPNYPLDDTKRVSCGHRSIRVEATAEVACPWCGIHQHPLTRTPARRNRDIPAAGLCGDAIQVPRRARSRGPADVLVSPGGRTNRRLGSARSQTTGLTVLTSRLVRADGLPGASPAPAHSIYSPAGPQGSARPYLLGDDVPLGHEADTTVRKSFDPAMTRACEARQLALIGSDRPIDSERH